MTVCHWRLTPCVFNGLNITQRADCLCCTSRQRLRGPQWDRLQLLAFTIFSTSGVIDNTCAVASITLPVAYADTNYRLFCTGISPMYVPVIVTVTKSNTTFTITIAILDSGSGDLLFIRLRGGA